MVENRRFKAVEVYPNIGTTFNILDEYLWVGRINNDSLSFPYYGVFYILDDNMQAIPSSRKDIGKPTKFVDGKVDIFDTTVIDVLLDQNNNILLFNQDGSQEMLFNISDSTDIQVKTPNSPKIFVSVYSDKVIAIYAVENESTYKIIIFNPNC